MALPSGIIWPSCLRTFSQGWLTIEPWQFGFQTWGRAVQLKEKIKQTPPYSVHQGKHKGFQWETKSGSNETEVMEYSLLLCTHLCPLAIQRHSNPSCSRPEREKCGRLADGMSMLASVIDLAKWILYNLFVFIAPGLLKLERIING